MAVLAAKDLTFVVLVAVLMVGVPLEKTSLSEPAVTVQSKLEAPDGGLVSLSTTLRGESAEFDAAHPPDRLSLRDLSQLRDKVVILPEHPVRSRPAKCEGVVQDLVVRIRPCIARNRKREEDAWAIPVAQLEVLYVEKKLTVRRGG